MFERISINDQSALRKTCETLDKGGIIVYPTDTIYGFGCDAFNDDAIQKLNLIKQRQGPMSVLCPNIETGLSWMKLSNVEKENAKNKIEPETTIIVPIIDDIVSKLIIGEAGSLGIRIPNHDFCINLAQNYSNPITTTSVNRSGQAPHTDPDEIAKEFHNEIDLCIDDGVIKGKGSKIYQFKGNKWKVLRS